jgi:outer membrane protein OmpA-like peptidoglycan-associated protein
MRFLYSLIFILYSILVIGQNLVPNPGFESLHECPQDYNKVNGAFWAMEWYAANGGTPDCFHPCSKLSGIPRNWMGYAEAPEGQAYAGVIVCMRRVDPKQIAYREYIGIKLTEPLQQNKTYCASVKIRLGLSCIATCNGFGMLFTDRQIISSGTVNFPLAPQIGLLKPLMDKNQWVVLADTLRAKGGEQYLTLGNFLGDQQITYHEFDENYIETQHISQYAYLYIDDVVVEPFQKDTNNLAAIAAPKLPEGFDGQLPVGVILTLDHVLFETDSSAILPQSFNQLDHLVAAMRKSPAVKIAINGDTDNTGTEDYNNRLSTKRAEAVRNYLLSKGISRFRISAKGYGSAQPVADNLTDEGRTLNRRVEIEVLK